MLYLIALREPWVPWGYGPRIAVSASRMAPGVGRVRASEAAIGDGVVAVGLGLLDCRQGRRPFGPSPLCARL